MALTFNGITYDFVANYYGGSGNDLVLVWAYNRCFDWGLNYYGQLGDNTTSNRLVPIPVTATGVLVGKTILSIAAGTSHNLALCSDGTVAAWGANDYGKLGNNTTNASLVPVAVSTNSALSNKTVVALAAGIEHSLALCSDGTVVAWGSNGSGELGNPSIATKSLVPVPVATNTALLNKKVVAIVAEYASSMALLSNGTLVAWGDNYDGQLGTGGGTTFTPAAVSTNTALSNKTVIAIANGYSHVLALCSDGTLAAWGENTQGGIGDGTLTNRALPVLVTTNGTPLSGRTVVGIAAGGYHSLALCSDGTLTAWGNNLYGQLGDGSASGFRSLVAVAVTTNGTALANKSVVSLAAGNYHSLALCSDGTLASWGWNSFGQVGDNSTSSRFVPVAVNTNSLASVERFQSIRSSDQASHSLAVVASLPTPRTTGITLGGGGAVPAFTGFPGISYDLLASSNLVDWLVLTNQTPGTNGLLQFTDPAANGYTKRVYRAKLH